MFHCTEPCKPADLPAQVLDFCSSYPNMRTGDWGAGQIGRWISFGESGSTDSGWNNGMGKGCETHGAQGAVHHLGEVSSSNIWRGEYFLVGHVPLALLAAWTQFISLSLSSPPASLQLWQPVGGIWGRRKSVGEEGQE